MVLKNFKEFNGAEFNRWFELNKFNSRIKIDYDFKGFFCIKKI